MECYCYLRNIQDLLTDGKTTYERRFGEPFKGPVIPFGSMVDCHPNSTNDQSRLHQFGESFVELEQMDASEIHARRLNAKEVLTPMKGDTFIFPVADGTVKISGGDQRLRTFTLTWDRPERGKEQEILEGNSGGLSSPTPQQDDSTLDDAEAKNDFWSITGDFICRHHVEPRGKLYMPKEESFLIPLTYIDVTRNTHTSLNVMLEKNIDDNWNVDGDRELSDTWIGFTRFTKIERKNHQMGIRGPGGD